MSFSERGELNRILGLKWSESIFISANEMIGALEKHISGLKDQENAMLLSSYNAVSNEVKRARLIEQRNELQEKYNELASQEQSIWAGNEFARTAQLELYEKQILHLNKQIEEYGTTIGTTVEKNKAYWEEEKKNAEEALGLLTEKNTAKEWEEARQRIIRAEKELDRYRVSIKEEETPDYYIFPRITRENTERIIEEVREFNKKMLSENEKAVKEQFKAEEEARIEYLIRWGNFEEKKNALIDKFNKEAKEARTKAEEDNLFRVLLEDLDRLAVEEFRGKIDFAEIFSNIDEKSVGAIKILRDKLAKYIELAANSMSPEQLKPLTDALISMDNLLKERNPAVGLSKSISSAKEAYKELKEAEKAGLSDENIKNYEIKFKDAMASVAAYIDNVVGRFSDFGNIAVDLINNVGGGEVGDIASDIIDIATGAGQAGMGVAKLFAGDIIGGAKDLAKGIADVVKGIVSMNDKAKERNIQDLEVRIDRLKDSYENLSKEISKAYSQDASKLIEQSNVILRQQQIALKQQIAEEKAKKKSDEKRIKEWEREYEEINKLIEDNKEKAVDAIFGQDVKNAISDFTNAYVSAWGAGEDKIKSTKDAVYKMIRGVITEMINADFAPTVEALRDKIRYFLTDGIIDSYEQEQLDRLIEAETNRIDKKYGWGDKYMIDREEQGQATYGAYEKITQEQASSIDGKLNGIQMSAITISDTNKEIKSVADETYKLIFLQVSHLESIKKNTALLVETNERLDKIVKNTSNL
jgi:DNA repair exonuclease SbcCD ATPase subunit